MLLVLPSWIILLSCPSTIENNKRVVELGNGLMTTSFQLANANSLFNWYISLDSLKLPKLVISTLICGSSHFVPFKYIKNYWKYNNNLYFGVVYDAFIGSDFLYKDYNT